MFYVTPYFIKHKKFYYNKKNSFLTHFKFIILSTLILYFIQLNYINYHIKNKSFYKKTYFIYYLLQDINFFIWFKLFLML